MPEHLPSYIPVVFCLACLLTLVLFYLCLRNAGSDQTRSLAWRVAAGSVVWLALHAILAVNGFYEKTQSLPPNFVFAILPPVLLILVLFTNRRGRAFMQSLPLKQLTYLHMVRIPVEIVLYWLYLNKAVPELMTFEGRNFDILAGLSAPIFAYYCLSRKQSRYNALLVWNIVALALLLNIVTNAVLSAPFALQQFAFDQPNIALLYFPFIWLPAYIVPTVLFSHLVSIRQLIKLRGTGKNP